jgi:hypothetical protein
MKDMMECCDVMQKTQELLHREDPDRYFAKEKMIELICGVVQVPDEVVFAPLTSTLQSVTPSTVHESKLVQAVNRKLRCTWNNPGAICEQGVVEEIANAIALDISRETCSDIQMMHTYKGEAYVYCPYCFYTSPTFFDPQDFTSRRGVLYKYAKFIARINELTFLS